MPVIEKEIVVGAVVFLVPEILTQHGAQCYSKGWETEAVHPFLCIDSDGESSLWIPLSSKPGGGGDRLRIPDDCRHGTGTFMSMPSYVSHPRQVWRCPNRAVVAASVQDYADSSSRCYVNRDGVGLVIAQSSSWGAWTSVHDQRPPTEQNGPLPQRAPTALIPPMGFPVPPAPPAVRGPTLTSALLSIPVEPPEEMEFDARTFTACSRVVAAMETAKRRRRELERSELEEKLRKMYEEDGVPVPSNLRRAITGAGATARESVEEERKRADLLTPLLRFVAEGRKTKEQILDYLCPLSCAKGNPRQNIESGVFYVETGALRKGRIRQCGREEYEITDAGRAWLAYKGAALAATSV